MKQVVAVFLAVVFVMSCVAIAQVARGAEDMERSELVTARATVESVDMKNRVVTLRGPEGKAFSVKVGEDVRNLSQVKPGDRVMVQYYESIALQMVKPGERPMTSVTETTRRVAPGQQPGGSRIEQITTTATIQSIDRKTSEVTLRGPAGNLVTVKARDPKNLEGVKVGDQIEITYTQSLAISLEKTKG
ncbi:MAG: hypothetical protein ABSC19_03980 [Syntrophorhabdales bacterium]|jgi:Cu/Ag efflux protein CusF